MSTSAVEWFIYEKYKSTNFISNTRLRDIVLENIQKFVRMVEMGVVFYIAGDIKQLRIVQGKKMI